MLWLVLIFVAVFVFAATYQGGKSEVKKETGQQQNAEETKPSAAEQKILNDPNFQNNLSQYRQVYRWMTLASGSADLLFPPLCEFERIENTGMYKVALVKHGSDLTMSGLRAYYSSTNEKERKIALAMFVADLFMDHYKEMMELDLAWIADDLITLVNEGKYSSDFIITYNIPVYFATYEEALLFERELGKTHIEGVSRCERGFGKPPIFRRTGE